MLIGALFIQHFLQLFHHACNLCSFACRSLFRSKLLYKIVQAFEFSLLSVLGVFASQLNNLFIVLQTLDESFEANA